MFPEYRDLISRLKSENPRFLSLFEKHNSLDRGYSLDIVRLKKQKLHLKEDLLKILQRESVSES